MEREEAQGHKERYLNMKGTLIYLYLDVSLFIYLCNPTYIIELPNFVLNALFGLHKSIISTI